jgi:hypothetical protein
MEHHHPNISILISGRCNSRPRLTMLFDCVMGDCPGKLLHVKVKAGQTAVVAKNNSLKCPLARAYRGFRGLHKLLFPT